MKLILVLFSALFLAGSASAEEIVAWTDYKPVRIQRVVAGDIELEGQKAGNKGAFKIVKESDLPTDRSDRDVWKFERGEIKADEKLKKENDKQKDKKQSDKLSAIKKLKTSGLTDEELSALKIGV